jgi:hypothetical protein
MSLHFLHSNQGCPKSNENRNKISHLTFVPLLSRRWVTNVSEEAIGSSETLVITPETTRRHNPEDHKPLSQSYLSHDSDRRVYTTSEVTYKRTAANTVYCTKPPPPSCGIRLRSYWGSPVWAIFSKKLPWPLLVSNSILLCLFKEDQ